MTEIERRLRELGSAVRGPGWDGPLNARVRRRIRRRRVMFPAGALCAAVGVVGGATLLFQGEPHVRRDAAVAAATSSPREAPAARLAPREVPEDGFSAVWPEDNPAAATRGCTEATAGSFRTEPLAMASAFGREVMGWDAATTTVTGATSSSRQVELRNEAVGSRVNVSVVELVENCWAVQSVFEAPGDHRTNVVMDGTVQGAGAVVRVGFLAPADGSGEVEVGYGESVERRSWEGPVTTADPIRIELAERGDSTGHLFVFFEDDTGTVTKALAYSLPPRHFSKEARERAAGP